MYINRQAEDIFKLAALAAAKKLFDNLITATIKEIAREAGVSEKQLHFWKNRLLSEGPKLFLLKPGKKKEDFSSLKEGDKLLVYETINNLLAEGKKQDGKNQKFSPEFKEKILRERERLKKEQRLTYRDFSGLIGISLRSIVVWSWELKHKGPEGLKDDSRAPKESPRKLSPELIKEILWYGTKWKNRHKRIRLTDFGTHFRWEYRRILGACGRSNLSDKTIGRYLKAAGLYQEKEERPKGKRGAFRYYFPGAQVLVDTTVIRFLGIKARLISVMDALSRSIFYQEAFLSENALKVIKSLKASFKKARGLGLNVLSLVSDHGRAYKANKVREYLKGQGIYRIFSAPYWPQGKAALERYFRTVKEGIGNRWEVFILAIKGLFLWLKERISLICLNLILIGFNGEYEKRKGIDGRTPGERLEQNVSPEYRKAADKIFKEEESESQLKAELISAFSKEFGFGMKIEKVKNYAGSYRRGLIEKSAQALRRKLVMEELEPLNRWYYFSKVLENLEKERKDAELVRAKEIVRQEMIENKDREEKQKVLEERRWRDAHPEEVLDEAIEWKLAFWDNFFTRAYYDKVIIDSSKKILMKHSGFTAELMVDKLCRRIQEKDRLENGKVIKKGYSLPPADKLDMAKEKVIALIRQSYLECQDQIPAFQGLRTLL